MNELVNFFQLLGLILTFIFLTVVEIFLLKSSKREDSPEFIRFPVFANIFGIGIVSVLTLVGIMSFGIGFDMAFGGMSAEGDKYAFLMMAAFALIPILMIIVRTILFLRFKLGKFQWALLYSLATTVVILFLLIISTNIFATIYENLLK